MALLEWSAAILGLLSLGQAAAKPEVKAESSLVLASGKPTIVMFYGEALAPTGLVLKLPLSGRLIATKPTEGDSKKRGSIQVEAELTAGALPVPTAVEVGLQHVGAVVTRSLVALPAGFTVLQVKRPNQTPAQAMTLSDSRIAVTGALNADSPDIFRFHAKAGDTWEIGLFAGSLGSALDAMVRVRNPRRASIALLGGSEKRDRHLSLTAVSDGDYTIELTDAESRGGETFRYVLTVMRVETTRR